MEDPNSAWIPDPEKLNHALEFDSSRPRQAQRLILHKLLETVVEDITTAAKRGHFAVDVDYFHYLDLTSFSSEESILILSCFENPTKQSKKKCELNYSHLDTLVSRAERYV